MLEVIKQAPFIRLIVAFITGIIIQFLFRINNPSILYLIIITFVISISLCSINNISSAYKYRWIYGILIHVFFILLGIFLTGQKITQSESWKYNEKQNVIIGVLNDYPQIGLKTVHCYLQINSINDKTFKKITDETILVHFQKNYNALKLKKGDRLIIKSILKKPSGSGNPGDFNYPEYLNSKGIHAIAYADSNHWKYLGAKTRFLPLVWSDKLRVQLTLLLSQSGLKGEELGVATSLLIGDESGVDNDLKQAYKASGTMHVLAVSGMHVALIYEVMVMLLIFLKKKKYGTIIRSVIILLVIWLYAMVTGLSPSVLRATVMFTFIILGLASSRYISVFNSLSASAFFLLLINPLNLADVGFQLSYLAVAGIVIIYPWLNGLWEFKSKIANTLWSLTSVTMAAQIATTPISLYYFHQFPNFFLLSNLIIVPLSTVIIYAAIVLTIFSALHLFVALSGKVLFGLVWFLNAIVKTIEKTPYSVTNGLYPTQYDTLLFYVVICFIIMFVFTKNRKFIRYALVSILLILSTNVQPTYNHLHQKEIIVYHDKDNCVVQFINGRQSVWIIDRYTSKIQSFVKYSKDVLMCDQNIYLSRNDINMNSIIKLHQILPEFKISANLITFCGKSFSFENNPLKTDTTNFNPDYLIPGNNNYKLQNVKPCHKKVKCLILSTALNEKEKNFYKKYYSSSMLYEVSEKGALNIKIN